MLERDILSLGKYSKMRVRVVVDSNVEDLGATRSPSVTIRNYRV